MSPADDATSFDRLWDAMARALESPCAESEIGSIGFDARLPSQWLTWTLIGLVRYRRKMIWDALSGRLRADFPELADVVANGLPFDQPGIQDVPGLRDWQYQLTDWGATFTRRSDEMQVAVEHCMNGDHGGMVTDLLPGHLRQQHSLDAADARLLQLCPLCTLDIPLDPRAFTLEYESLASHGLLQGKICLALTPLAKDREALIVAFCQAWEDPARQAYLAASIGDWLGARNALRVDSSPGCRRHAEIQAEVNISERIAFLRQRQVDQPALVLVAMWEIDAPEKQAMLRDVLRYRSDEEAIVAIRILERQPDSSNWCSEVYARFRRNRRSWIFEVELWLLLIRFLMRQQYRVDRVKREVDRNLLQIDHDFGTAILLAIEYFPGKVVRLVRRGLKSDSESNRFDVAAILALFDQHWSRIELAIMLRQSNDPQATAAMRAALGLSKSSDAQNVVTLWEQCHLESPGVTEVVHHGISKEELLACYMRKHRDQVEPLRSIRDDSPPETSS